MAGVPISLLPQGTLPYTGTERFAFVQDGETRANNIQSLVSYYDDYFVTYSELDTLSGNWQSTYLTLEIRGALWDSHYSVTSNLSSNWNSVYSTVESNSASWGSSNDFCGQTVYLETIDPCAGTGDTVTVNANLDVQGFSIDNIGNSSLNFESGAKISSNTNGGVLILPNPSNIPGKWGTAIGLNCNAPAAQSLASGKNTSASGDMAMAHGLGNSASAPYSIAAGGQSNVIDPLGLNSAILGGKNNRLQVSDSTAMGTYAQSLSHAGSFVFADGSTTAAFTPVSANSFNIKAAGGLRLIDGNQAAGKVLTCDADGTGHWETGYDDSLLRASSADWENTYNVVESNSASWGTGGSFDPTEIQTASGDWDSTYTTVQDSSASWGLGGSDGDFCGTVVNMDELSACGPTNTISVTGDIDLNGGSLLNVGNNSITFESGAAISSEGGNISFGTSPLSSTSTIHAADGDSSQWNSAYSTVESNSASWGAGGDLTDLQSASGSWDSTYTTVSSSSASWGGGTQLAESVNASFTALIAADGHSYNGTDGNARGLNAVDLQIRRSAMTEVAGGSISTIVGGQSNEISNGGGGVNGQYSTIIGGGFNDIIIGQYATILGGYANQVNPDSGNANYSIACGAQAHAKHANAFVFNDSAGASFASLQSNTFNIHATNGLRLITDGTQTAGQVLTCDADGHGSWQDAPEPDVTTTVQANSGNWQIDALQIAASDETTDLTTGIVTTFRAPYAIELTDVRASVTTAPVGADITVDVTSNGTTIFSTIISIDDGSKTSVGSASPRVISTTSIPDDAELKIDIKTVGSTTAGTGLKLSFIGYKS